MAENPQTDDSKMDSPGRVAVRSLLGRPGSEEQVDSRISQIEEHVMTCAVCHEVFTDPRMLPCQHSFCSKCIESIILFTNSPENIINCPMCCSRHSVPPTGFPISYAIASLLDLTSAPVATPSSSTTSLSRPRSDAATLECSPITFCPTHNIVMNYYCITCRVLVCKLCFKTSKSSPVSSQHGQGHVVDEIENLKKSCIAEIKSLKSKCEASIVKLDKDEDELLQKDAAAIKVCQTAIDRYYDKQEGKMEKEIQELSKKLEAIKVHRQALVDRVDEFSCSISKKRLFDRNRIEQLKEDITRSITTAESLIRSDDDTMIVLRSDKITEKLKIASCSELDTAFAKPPPKLSFSKSKDPLACEVINPREVIVEGLEQAKSGANTFTLKLTTPLINEPQLRVSITLPNGKMADFDTIQITELEKHCSWSISYYVPKVLAASTLPVLSNIFSSAANRVTLSVKITLCDIEVEGSPFQVPCEKSTFKEFFGDISI